MDTRSFAISTLSAIGLSLTAGCGEPIVGTWDVVSIKEGEETQTWPMTMEGQGYTVTVSADAVIGDDLTGSFNLHGTANANGEEQTKDWSQGLTVTKTGKGAYTFDIAANEENEMEATSMTCTLDDQLVCTDDDGVVATLAERQE